MFDLKTILSSIVLAVSATAVISQALTPEEIERMLDAEAAEENPYAALLNDPDPKRSLGALRIMMESGDQELIDIAKEFGLLSSEARVREATFEYYLATEPRIAVEFDVSKAETSNGFKGTISSNEGTITSEKMAFATWRVGKYDDAKGCYVWEERSSQCLFRIDASGIFFSGSYFIGKVTISNEGNVIGPIQFDGMDEEVPTLVRLLD